MRPAASLLLLALVSPPASAGAQPALETKQQFVAAAIRLMDALPGAFGDEGPRVAASLDAMEAGLRRWDVTLGAYEAAMSAQIRTAAPSVAAGLHVTLGAVFLERGRIDAALREFAAASALDPKRADAYMFSGLASELARRDADASAAFRTSWTLDPFDPARAYLFLQHLPAASAPREPLQAMDALVAFQKQRESEPGSGRAAPFLSLRLVEDDGGQSPVFPLALYVEGFARLARGEYQDAIDALRAGAAADPLSTIQASGSESLARGIRALRDGEVSLAVSLLQSATRDHPDSSEAHRLLGRAYWFDDRLDKSAEECEAAIRLRPSDERSRLQWADVLVELREYRQAEEVLKAAIAAIPATVQAHWRLGQLYHVLNRDGEARQEFERAARSPALAGAARVEATISGMYLAEADLEGAAAHGRRRIALEPNAGEAHRDLGGVYRKQNRERDALVEFLVATLLDPRDADAYAAIGQMHLGGGRYADALDPLNRTLTFEPDHADAHYALASALIRLGRSDEGSQHLETARRLQATRMEAVRRGYETNLTKIEAAGQEIDGRFEEAARLWRIAADREPGVTSTYVSLARALAKTGEHVKAIEAFEQALKAAAGPEIYRDIAEEYLKLGRREESEAARITYERLKDERLRRLGAGR